MPLVVTPRPSHSSEARNVMSLRIRASTASLAAWPCIPATSRPRTAHACHRGSPCRAAITIPYDLNERRDRTVASGDVDQPRDPPGLDRKDIRIVAGGGRRRACLAAASYVSGSKGIDAGTERKIRQGAWLVISFTSQLFSSPDDK